MKSQLKILQERAHRWWEWAAGIRAASELESAKPFVTGYFPLLDTSEIVEYARPSSKLRNEYPTRLDIALNLLLARGKDVFMSGPHAREIRGVALGWQEHMSQALVELRLMRQQLRDPVLDVVNKDLQRIYEGGVRNAAQELVQLLRENYRWVFAESRLRPTDLFGRLLLRLSIPSATELGLPDGWRFKPDTTRVEMWRQRLHQTGLGKKEPGPNLVDAYALDQLEQVAAAIAATGKEHRLPILLSHSGKIFEALRNERATDSGFCRVRGVSLVQPPQMVLVLRLRDDAIREGRLGEVTEELGRQMARGETINELLRSASAKSGEAAPPPSISYEKLEEELDQFEKSWDQWDALRQVQQSFQEHDDAPGMLDGLEKILRETSPDDANYLQSLLGRELDKLISEVDRLQGEITNHISPPDAPAATELQLESETSKKIATVLVRFRTSPTVPSAAYPIPSFHFRDAKMIEELSKMTAALEELRTTTRSQDERTRIQELWHELHATHELLDQPEFFLLLAVLYLAQEKWMQAHDMASQGLLALEPSSQAAAAELHLARAGAGRAFVHSVRMDFPATCEAFLQSAVDDCLKSLELQDRNTADRPDGRCLRELAVIYCSAHDPVYGPNDTYRPIQLKIDKARLARWTEVEGVEDSLSLAGVLARRAYDENSGDTQAAVLYENTHLYVMTELDRRHLDAEETNDARYENDRIRLATSLEKRHAGDPNLLDTLMWHHRVLAEAQKRRNAPWGRAAKEAENYSNQLTDQAALRGNTNQYYQRLVDWHQIRVARSIA